MSRPALPAEEVRKAVEHRGPCRVPMLIHQWNWAGAFGDRTAQVQELQAQYPQDVHFVSPRQPAMWDDPKDPNVLPGYSWMDTPPPATSPDDEKRGHDSSCAIRDWAQLDGILAAFPRADHPRIFEGLKENLAQHAQGRYCGFHWWFCFYERLWSMRGMENILCDFYEHPAPVHRLMDALCDFYCGYIRRAGRELKVDAIWTTDDIGMQTGPMFSPRIFREFFKPRYQRLIAAAHEYHLHFWLHTCGNVTPFLDDFAEIGLDVIHPIQKYTMDERATAARIGGKIAVWAGMDVQQILPRGTPEDVRREVRFMIDTYDRPDGGCLITAGNGITPDVPVANLAAFYDETWEYGLAHRRQFAH